eukprot:587755-Amphidinium_carterae.1
MDSRARILKVVFVDANATTTDPKGGKGFKDSTMRLTISPCTKVQQRIKRGTMPKKNGPSQEQGPRTLAMSPKEEEPPELAHESAASG